MILSRRVKFLNEHTHNRGSFAVYWMQAAQRAHYNHALEYALRQANSLNIPLVVYFGLTPVYPGANLRHYAFMLEGLMETARDLGERGIKFMAFQISPEAGILELAGKAAFVAVDDGYTAIQRKWRELAAQGLSLPVIQVSTNVIVPVDEVSSKEEFAARTIRPKIHRLLDDYMIPLEEAPVKMKSAGISTEEILGPENAGDGGLSEKNINLEEWTKRDLDEFLSGGEFDRGAQRVDSFMGGTSEALAKLHDFIDGKIVFYDTLRNDPTRDYLSNMSPYLHFGQVSPLHIALKVRETGEPGAKAYLEELIVRRELSMNYVWYNPHYDKFSGLPDWCKKTLGEHKDDPREYIYTREQLENARTHDPYWNAAQREMVLKGKMHGYMRMYWGKKIMEWAEKPEEAFETMVFLNDKYELDGRDPNGYTGAAWCFGKHDRPWKERPVFGKIRYMNDKGLKRKFDADAYLEKIREI